VDTKECTVDIAWPGARSGEELALPDVIRIEKEIAASGLILSSQHRLLAELDNMCKKAGLCRTCKCRAPREPSHGHHLCLCESSASIEDLAENAGALRRVSCPCIRLAVQLIDDMPDLVSDDESDSDEDLPFPERVDDDDEDEEEKSTTPLPRREQLARVRRALAPEFDKIAAREGMEGDGPSTPPSYREVCQCLAADPRFVRIFAPLRPGQQRLMAYAMYSLSPRERGKYFAALDQLTSANKEAGPKPKPKPDPVSSITIGDNCTLRYNRDTRVINMGGSICRIPKFDSETMDPEDLPQLDLASNLRVDFSFRNKSGAIYADTRKEACAIRREAAAWLLDLYEAGAFE